MNVPFKILYEELYNYPPVKSPENAGLDLRMCLPYDLTLHPEDEVLVPTGLAVKLPTGYVGFALPRSGMGAKMGVVLGNLVGTIDEGYTGEIMLKLWNRRAKDGYNKPIEIVSMERVAQLVIVPCLHYTPEFVDTLPRTDRGATGFGDSGRV